MQAVDHAYQTLYSELAQRSLDAAFNSEFSPEGRFISMESRGRRYWYFDTTEAGKRKRRYVGPVDDAEVTKRVEHFKDLKADVRARRKMVSTLVREAHLPRPDRKAGEIIEALSDAGFFRLRGVLIGTVAFHCYPAILGVARVPSTALQTADADLAQFHSISVAVDDQLPELLPLLRGIDPTFREVPDRADSRYTTSFQSRSGYKVEFLTPNTGAADNDDRPTTMPTLGTTAARPLRFLDFLIYQPVRAVLLHKAGVPVLVPAPERYAVHKLIVAQRRLHDRDGTAKSRKDLLQSATLIEILLDQRETDALADAYMEAWDRGSRWRDAIRSSMATLDSALMVRTKTELARSIVRFDADPIDYGLAT